MNKFTIVNSSKKDNYIKTSGIVNRYHLYTVTANKVVRGNKYGSSIAILNMLEKDGIALMPIHFYMSWDDPCRNDRIALVIATDARSARRIVNNVIKNLDCRLAI